MPINSDIGGCMLYNTGVAANLDSRLVLGVQRGTSDIIHMNSGRSFATIVRPGKLPACQSILQIAGNTV